jgi:drug/metabolite transporter (DMT)-like permease
MGEFFSIICSLFWAISVILFKHAGKNLSSKHVNAYKTTIVSVLFLITLLITNEIKYFYIAETKDLIILIIVSFVGMTLADTIYYKSLKLLNASIIAIVAASQPPIMILLSFIFYGEKLFPKDYFGAALVCIAIVLSSNKAKKNVKINYNTVKGVLLGILSVALMSASILYIKNPSTYTNYSILEKYPPIFISALRIFLTSLVLTPVCLIAKDRLAYINLFKINNKLNKYIIPASISGGYLSLIFWILGNVYIEKISIANILNQMAIVFITVLAAIFLNEKLNLKKITAMILAIIGCVIVLI